MSEKHDQTSINLNNVFNFIGCLNYVAFNEIKWLSAFTECTTQKLIVKHSQCQ